MLAGITPKDNREWQATSGLDNQCFANLLSLTESSQLTLAGKSYEQVVSESPQPIKPKLTTLDSLIFYTLFVLKTGITFDVAAFVVQFDQSRAHRQFQRGLRLIHHALEVEGYMPVRSISNPEEFRQIIEPDTPIIIDATEQPIQRPLDREHQKEAYSGKKKHHTHKSMIISTMDRYIHYVSNSYVGSIHDYSLLKEEFDPQQNWFKDYPVRLDLGYQGFQKDYPMASTYLPQKKPKGGQLTEEQKQRNRELATERIKVEHAVRGIKRYDIVSSASRIHNIDTYDMMTGTCAALWNFFITR